MRNINSLQMTIILQLDLPHMLLLRYTCYDSFVPFGHSSNNALDYQL